MELVWDYFCSSKTVKSVITESLTNSVGLSRTLLIPTLLVLRGSTWAGKRRMSGRSLMGSGDQAGVSYIIVLFTMDGTNLNPNP